MSIGFYGFKTGLFTLRTGGNFVAGGPAGTMLAERNHIAVAIVMVVPLIWYLRSHISDWYVWPQIRKRFSEKTVSRVLLLILVLSIIGAIGSQSRGALLATCVAGLVIVVKSKQGRFQALFAMVLLAPLVFAFMPESWHQRMDTIEEYEQDASAMGRINAWRMSFNLAKDRFVGGGFEPISYELFARYAPNPLDVHDTHSIYFQMMAQHGFLGFALFLALGLTALLTTRSIQKRAALVPDLVWASDLARMIQASLAGYAVGGAFVNLAYLDLYYDLLAMVVATHVLVLTRVGIGGQPREEDPIRDG